MNLLKIDNTLFDNPDFAESATVYAVANVAAELFREDNDGDGRPDIIRNRSDLENLVYSIDSDMLSLGLPDEGMPMVRAEITVRWMGCKG